MLTCQLGCVDNPALGMQQRLECFDACAMNTNQLQADFQNDVNRIQVRPSAPLDQPNPEPAPTPTPGAHPNARSPP